MRRGWAPRPGHTSIALPGPRGSGSGRTISVQGLEVLRASLRRPSLEQVLMINGGSPCNVSWQVGSSTTLGTGSTFVGSLLALTSITLTIGVSLAARALARNGGAPAHLGDQRRAAGGRVLVCHAADARRRGDQRCQGERCRPRRLLPIGSQPMRRSDLTASRRERRGARAGTFAGPSRASRPFMNSKAPTPRFPTLLRDAFPLDTAWAAQPGELLADRASSLDVRARFLNEGWCSRTPRATPGRACC